MTEAQAHEFGWVVAGPVVGFVMLVAVVLLGLALLHELSRW
ncbi:hypothetical protein [Nocardioides sp.]